MADMKIEYEEVPARRKGRPALPAAVVYSCRGGSHVEPFGMIRSKECAMNEGGEERGY